MPGKRKRSVFPLSSKDIERLEKIITSRTMPASKVQRAKILYLLHQGKEKSEITKYEANCFAITSLLTFKYYFFNLNKI